MAEVIEKSDIVQYRREAELFPDYPDVEKSNLLEVHNLFALGEFPYARCKVLRHTFPELVGATVYRRVEELTLVESS